MPTVCKASELCRLVHSLCVTGGGQRHLGCPSSIPQAHSLSRNTFPLSLVHDVPLLPPLLTATLGVCKDRGTQYVTTVDARLERTSCEDVAGFCGWSMTQSRERGTGQGARTTSLTEGVWTLTPRAEVPARSEAGVRMVTPGSPVHPPRLRLSQAV